MKVCREGISVAWGLGEMLSSSLVSIFVAVNLFWITWYKWKSDRCPGYVTEMSSDFSKTVKGWEKSSTGTTQVMIDISG